MKATFKKYKVDGNIYYLAEKGDTVALINSESYHKPFDKFMNSWFVYYIYKKVEGWEVADYVYSYDYDTYQVLPTLRECKEAVLNFYLSEK